MENKIDLITQSFISEFDVQWNLMLNELGLNQFQLNEGNRLRPQMCLWGYLAAIPELPKLPTSLSNIAITSVSLEMIHKASLLIDDWIDDDDIRHGKPSYHVEYSPQEAVLVALNLIGFSMIRLKKIFTDSTIILPFHYFTYLDTILSTIYSMAQGALMELKLTDKDFFDSSKIKHIIQLETAEILGNSLLLGYYTGLGEKEKNIEVENFFHIIGEQCGFLFQVMNDLEVFSNPHKLYLHKGNLNFDILKKRKNYAVSVLYEMANSNDKLLLEKETSFNIIPFMEKYHVLKIIRRQLENIYSDLQNKVNDLSKLGLSSWWCNGFNDFLNYVKKFGESRLAE